MTIIFSQIAILFVSALSKPRIRAFGDKTFKETYN